MRLGTRLVFLVTTVTATVMAHRMAPKIRTFHHQPRRLGLKRRRLAFTGGGVAATSCVDELMQRESQERGREFLSNSTQPVDGLHIEHPPLAVRCADCGACPSQMTQADADTVSTEWEACQRAQCTRSPMGAFQL